jgi:hypothetical protein
MARPKPQAALTTLTKAPTREHPVIPAAAVNETAALQTPSVSEPASSPVPKPAEELTVMFSARISRSLRRRVKHYSADADESLQAIAEAALSEYLDNKGAAR